VNNTSSKSLNFFTGISKTFSVSCSISVLCTPKVKFRTNSFESHATESLENPVYLRRMSTRTPFSPLKKPGRIGVTTPGFESHATESLENPVYLRRMSTRTPFLPLKKPGWGRSTTQAAPRAAAGCAAAACAAAACRCCLRRRRWLRRRF
jgi:hypothetical protein